MIFVFGSNLGGRHGAGAALTALREYGAILGVEGHMGFHGNSYAIPTKDGSLRTLTLKEINVYVENFISFAINQQKREFQVTRIGCGRARLRDQDMAKMFENAPSNCYFDEKWELYLPQDKKIWGTFKG